eukprot:757040-Hanusia_phi.AAC.2
MHGAALRNRLTRALRIRFYHLKGREVLPRLKGEEIRRAEEEAVDEMWAPRSGVDGGCDDASSDVVMEMLMIQKVSCVSLGDEQGPQVALQMSAGKRASSMSRIPPCSPSPRRAARLLLFNVLTAASPTDCWGGPEDDDEHPADGEGGWRESHPADGDGSCAKEGGGAEGDDMAGPGEVQRLWQDARKARRADPCRPGDLTSLQHDYLHSGRLVLQGVLSQEGRDGGDLSVCQLDIPIKQKMQNFYQDPLLLPAFVEEESLLGRGGGTLIECRTEHGKLPISQQTQRDISG